MTKGLKLKARKFLGIFPRFVEITREKLVEWGQSFLSLKSITKQNSMFPVLQPIKGAKSRINMPLTFLDSHLFY